MILSIIVTTYNRKDLLTVTINSILSQTFRDFELIVVDNFSNYNFFDLIDSFDDFRVRGYQNHNNGVIAINRNFGIQVAKGEYLAFCDDDDVWNSDKLTKQLMLAESVKHKHSLILIHSNATLVREGWEDKQTRKYNVHHFNDFIGKNDITFSTVLVTNSAKINFNEDPVMVAAEDYYLWMELLIQGCKFFLLEESLVSYRISSSSAFNNNITFRKLSHIIALFHVISRHKTSDFSLFKIFTIVVIDLVKFSIRLRLCNERKY